MNEGLATGESESMVWRAREFASRAHAGQSRHDGQEYIMHPFGVGLILEQMGVGPQIVAAGYLHDVLEKKKKTKSAKRLCKELAKEFGVEVADMVYNVSDLGLGTWQERKEAKLKRIPNMPIGSQLIIAADKINNLVTLTNAILSQGRGFLKKFNSNLKARLDMDERVLEALRPPLTEAGFGDLIDRFSESLDNAREASKPKKPKRKLAPLPTQPLATGSS